MKRVVALAVLAACHRAAAPTASGPGNEAADDDRVFLDAATLLVRGPDVTTPRVRVESYDRAWLDADGARAIVPDAAPDAWPIDVAVSETRGERVRVRFDLDDDARMLLWLDRASLATVVVHETGVASGPGAAFAEAGGVGVRLLPGTPLAELRDAVDPGRRVVSIRVDDVMVDGEVAADALGQLYVPVAVTAHPDRGGGYVGEQMPLRSAPRPDAPAIAISEWAVYVELVGEPVDGWVLVSTTGPHVIARGFVPEHEIGDALGGLMGTGALAPDLVSGFSIIVPAGACLHDGADGALAGIATAVRTRAAEELGDGWYGIDIESPWGDVPVAVHDASRCADPAQLVTDP